MTDRCNLQVTDYQILFDDDRYPASGCSLIKSGERLLMTVQRASDAERGISSLLTQRDDLGVTWTEPRPFGPPLADPDTEFQGVAPAHVLDDGTVVACGIYLPKGFDRASGGRGLYRPSDILIGHRAPDADEFYWNRIAAGTFLTEQFIAPGIALPDGRLVFTVWGSAVRGDNWQCGVLLSDDGGRTLRYRQVGYEPDPAIRKDPEVMAGFNEQTLFAAPDGTLVSVIRGRDHLGGIPGSNPRSSDCLFFRAEFPRPRRDVVGPGADRSARHRSAGWRPGATGRLPGPAGPPAVALEPPPRPLVLRDAHGAQLRSGPYLEHGSPVRPHPRRRAVRQLLQRHERHLRPARRRGSDVRVRPLPPRLPDRPPRLRRSPPLGLTRATLQTSHASRLQPRSPWPHL